MKAFTFWAIGCAQGVWACEVHNPAVFFVGLVIGTVTFMAANIYLNRERAR